MARYIITYDLAAPGRGYEELYDRIKSYGTWAHIMESVWAIVTTSSAAEVREYLSKALDDNDKLLVGPLGAAAWQGLSSKISNWLKDNHSG